MAAAISFVVADVGVGVDGVEQADEDPLGMGEFLCPVPLGVPADNSSKLWMK
jgi:hypothetical protein